MRNSFLLFAMVCVLMSPLRAQTHVEHDPAWVATFAEELAEPAYGAMLLTSEEGRTLLDEGRALMIAFRLDEAEAAFRRLDSLEPESPAAAHHLTTIALWHALMTEREPWYGRFFSRADSLKDRLGDLPDSAWKKHFEAELLTQRTIIYVKQERFTKAGLALRGAYNRYEDNVRDYPEFWESYKGMGLCHVAVGTVPRAYRWIMSILGFSGTVQQGMEEIELALTNSAYNREESALLLGIVDAIMNERRGGALRHVEAFYEAYPESPMPAYVYAFLLMNARRAVDAESVIREGLRRQEPEAVADVPYFAYYLADALFKQNRFEEAAPLFEGYVRSYRGQSLIAQGTLKAGLSREMLGDRARAVDHYERIRSDRDVDADKSAIRRAEQLMEHPMSDDERTLLLGQNLYDGGSYDEAIAILQPVLTDHAAAEKHRAEAAYRSARAFQSLENWDEALRHYTFARDNPGDVLAKWGPWSQYHIGEVHEEQDNRDEARRAYRAAIAYEEDFDYHKALEQRARTALGRL